jgi:tetratricopeptide (TPR) repeat protein
MRRSTIQLLTLAGFVIAITVPPTIPAIAAGGGADPPPSSSSSSSSDSSKMAPTKKKKDKRSEQEFIDGYRKAYATIYEREDYRAGIDQLHALKHDDQADVANLIGYSYRKLGDYQQSKQWYEAALKADPNHVRTWQYYGLWQIEQGHRDQAAANLEKIGSICGTSCPEYRSLAAALDLSTRGGHIVY